MQKSPVTDGFPNGFLGREPDGEMLGGELACAAIRDFTRREHSVEERSVVRQLREALDLDDIDADVHLFDRDTLGQISWLIDVAAAQDSHIVREKLKRNDGENGDEQFVYVRHKQ